MTPTDLLLTATTLLASAATAVVLGLWRAARRRERSAARAATVDGLTGLPNRVGFLDRLHATLAAASGATAVLFCDLDDFKAVNDRHGHAGGDRVLATVALRLRRAVRADDVVARYGGDEFTILAEVTDPGDARRLAERVHHALARPIALSGGTVTLGVSVGVALAPTGGTEPTLLIGAADRAMYRAKHGPPASTTPPSRPDLVAPLP